MTSYLKPSAVILFVLFICNACRKHGDVTASISVFPDIDTIGGVIAITGSGFSTDPTKDIVQFNDTAFGQVLTASANQLTVVVPFYTAKDRIIVRANGGPPQSTQEFQIAPKFIPQAEAPGYPVTIITGGSTILSDYTVSFNGATATPSKLIDSYLTVTIPSGATTGKVTVNFKGQSYTSLTDFTISPVGEVTNLTATGVLGSPMGMAVDKNGNLYVADLQDQVIDKVDPKSGAVSTYAGNGAFDYGGGSPLLAAGVSGTSGLAFGPDGNLYGVYNLNNRVFKITVDSVISILPNGNPPNSNVSSPSGIVFDGSGNFYVGSNVQVKEVSAGGLVSVVAGNGLQGVDNGPAADATFVGPTALALDGSGNLYICDNEFIRMLSNGIVSNFAGAVLGFQDGVGTNAEFARVNDMVRDPKSGNLYVTDPGNHVVRMITPGGVVTTIAGKVGQQGNQNGTGSNALFEGPSGITMDKNGVLYVSDGSFGNSSIRKIVLH